MNRQTQTEIATTLQEHGRIMARVRKAVVTDDSPLTVELGGDEVPASIVHGAAAGIGDIVDVLVAGNRPPLVLAGGPGNNAMPAARVYNSAAISLANYTATALTFNSERYDNDSIHSTSSNTGRLTATTAGVYQITGHVGFAGSGTGRRQIYIRLNGSTLIGVQDGVPYTSGSDCYLTVTAEYKLAATDYVELVAFQNSGGSINAVSGGSYTPEFAMHKVSDG